MESRQIKEIPFSTIHKTLHEMKTAKKTASALLMTQSQFSSLLYQNKITSKNLLEISIDDAESHLKEDYKKPLSITLTKSLLEKFKCDKGKKLEEISLAELHQLIHEKTATAIAKELNLTIKMFERGLEKFGTQYSRLKRIKIEDAMSILGDQYHYKISKDLIKTLMDKAANSLPLKEIPFRNLHKAILDAKKMIDTAEQFHVKEFTLRAFLSKYSINWLQLREITIADAENILNDSYNSPISAIAIKKLTDKLQIKNKSVTYSHFTFAAIHTAILSSDCVEDAAEKLGFEKNQFISFINNHNFSVSQLRNLNESTAKSTLGENYNQPISVETYKKLTSVFISDSSLKRKWVPNMKEIAKKRTKRKKKNPVNLNRYSISEIHQAILSTDTLDAAGESLKTKGITLGRYLTSYKISYTLLKKISSDDFTNALKKFLTQSLSVESAEIIKSIKITPKINGSGYYPCHDLKFSFVHEKFFQSNSLEEVANLLVVKIESLKNYLGYKHLSWEKLRMIPCADLKELFPYYEDRLTRNTLPFLHDAIMKWENQHQNKSEVESLSDDESEVHSLPDDEMEVTCSETDEPEEENDEISGQNEASVSLAKSHFGLFARKNSAPLNKQAENEIVYHPGK